MTTSSIPVKKGVISDFTVYNKALEESDFNILLKRGTPSSFFPFQKFESGDYSYEKAKIKIRLNNPVVSINEIETVVDVPDVFDSGISDTKLDTNEDTLVTFVKHFNVIPEVFTELLRVDKRDEFEGAVVRIHERTETSFKYKIISGDGDVLDGEISWLARGY